MVFETNRVKWYNSRGRVSFGLGARRRSSDLSAVCSSLLRVQIRINLSAESDPVACAIEGWG